MRVKAEPTGQNELVVMGGGEKAVHSQSQDFGLSTLGECALGLELLAVY